MNHPLSFQYGGYQLVCDAKPAEGGRFVPTLVVSKQVWPSRLRVIDVQRGQYESAHAAIDAARAEGLVWVRNYG